MKVICKKWRVCSEPCGAKFPHDDSSCEPCPFDPQVECVEVACRVCGCTDSDCSQCAQAQGHPCHWVEPDLCSRCADMKKTLPGTSEVVVGQVRKLAEEIAPAELMTVDEAAAALDEAAGIPGAEAAR